MSYIIQLDNITKRFPGIVANDHININVEKGEIHTLAGENGAGKSTLMNIMFGLYKPDEGQIYINGKEIKQNYLDESNYGKTYQLINITRMDITLGDDEYYVMGDNRSVSYDSRFFGPIKKKDIVGKVVLTYGKYKSYNTETGEGKDKQFFPIRFY